jgi:predicted TIM-barrel fold metal-dependent hydrolase
MLAALAEAPVGLRAIAVIVPETPEAELRRLHDVGVRGVRCNTRNRGGLGFELAADLARRIAPFRWTLQFQVLPNQVDALVELAPKLELPVILDHLGFIDVEPPDAALRRLRALLDAGDSYVKLSAPYRVGAAFAAPAVASIIGGLVTSHPERLIWGTDWPHTELWTGMPDDTDLIDELLVLLDDDAVRRAIFVDTPNRLFFN